MVTQEEMQAILAGSAQTLNTVLERTKYEAIEQVLLSLPTTLERLSVQVEGTRQQVKEFLARNPQVKGKGSIVGKTLARIETEHPDWSYDRVLQELETRLPGLDAKANLVTTDLNSGSNGAL